MCENNFPSSSSYEERLNKQKNIEGQLSPQVMKCQKIDLTEFDVSWDEEETMRI